jgi:hypothetical protein
MKPPQSESSRSPDIHSRNIQRELSRLIDHLEADKRRVDDQRFRGLLEKSSEILKELRSLFGRFVSDVGSKGNKQPASRARKKAKSDAASARNGGGSGKSTTRERDSDDSREERKQTGADVKSRAAKAAQPPKEDAAGQEAPQSATLTTPLPVSAAPKPPDPDEIAAKERQQRREARAPKMPGGKTAPRAIPPQSGKPVWNRPH